MPLVNCFIHILKFKMKIEVGSILKNKVNNIFESIYTAKVFWTNKNYTAIELHYKWKFYKKHTL